MLCSTCSQVETGIHVHSKHHVVGRVVITLSQSLLDGSSDSIQSEGEKLDGGGPWLLREWREHIIPHLPPAALQDPESGTASKSGLHSLPSGCHPGRETQPHLPLLRGL